MWRVDLGAPGGEVCFVESEKYRIWSVTCVRRVACSVHRVLNVKYRVLVCSVESAVWGVECRV